LALTQKTRQGKKVWKITLAALRCVYFVNIVYIKKRWKRSLGLLNLQNAEAASSVFRR
jgi:hypothetical protein